jgi:ketosteroid isomerase-like protein
LKVRDGGRHQLDGDTAVSAADNKKLMESLFARVAAGDRKPLLDHIADDVVMRVTGHYSWSQTIRGKEALFRDFYGHLASLLADGNRRTVGHRFFADGDHVVVESVGEMQTKAGAPYNNEYCLIYRLRDGKIVEIREYCDSALCERVLGPFPAERKRAAG